MRPPTRSDGQQKKREPRVIRPDDIDPHHGWDRPLQSPGHMQVDFEERVNFRRLHDYRLARTRAALSGSGLGALLCFDQHNIRYITSTVIGEWARDKLTRYSLLTGNGDPYIWDFGSAAKHHRLLRAVAAQRPLPRRPARLARRDRRRRSRCSTTRRARSRRCSTRKASATCRSGVDVVELPMMLELQKLGIDVRDAQQTHARWRARSRTSTS